MTLDEVLDLVQRYLKINKDLSMLHTGDGSFIKHYNPTTHRIHGKMDTLGAGTARCTHSNPNLSQAPKDKRFRELLCVPDDKVLIDVDAGALELVTLGHYLGKFDDYEFARVVDSGDKSKGTDIHTLNQKRVGLATRDLAKTFIYSVCYGAGNVKIGDSLWTKDTKLDYTPTEYNEAKNLVEKRVVELNGSKYYPISKGVLTPYTEELILKAIHGTRISIAFRDKTKGYNELCEWAISSAKDDHIVALDGRKLFLRSPHKALNLYLQSAGAIYMKHLLCYIDDKLQSKFKLDKDFAYVANIHRYLWI